MVREYNKSGLYKGEDVILPDNLFITGEKAKKRIIFCRFEDETNTGMIFNIQFQPGWGTEDPVEYWSYRIFIDYAAVYCGKIKIYRGDRSQLKISRAVEGIRI